MKQEYHSADNYLDSILATDPENVHTLYMKIAVMQSKLADYESYCLDGEQTIQYAQKVLALFDSKSDWQNDTTVLFYKGTIYGIMSLIKAKNGDFIPSVKYARISYDILEKLTNSGHYIPDGLYGTGLFDYYIGDNLRWVPGLGKRASAGLKKLYRASSSPSPFSYSSTISLLWILIEREKFAEADSLSSKLLNIYPDNTVLLQIKSRAVFGLSDYDTAISLSRKLIELSRKKSVINWTDVLSGYQLIAASSLKLNKKTDAIKAAQEGLSFKIPADTLKIDWVRKHREYLLNVK